MKRVTKAESREAREFANEIIQYLHEQLRDKYTFTQRLVGSVKYNTIIKDNDGMWDVDYQLLLTANSKEYKNNGLKYASNIKNDFFNCLNEKYRNSIKYRTENSTTAITVINKVSKYSIDFVIIRLYPDNKEIIRRNNKDGSGINEYTWNQLKKYNEAYEKFDFLNTDKKIDLIENYILPRKIKEKQKNDGDKTKKSSCELFVEEVNNYVARK